MPEYGGQEKYKDINMYTQLLLLYEGDYLL